MQIVSERWMAKWRVASEEMDAQAERAHESIKYESMAN